MSCRLLLYFFTAFAALASAQTSQALRTQAIKSEQNKDWFSAAQYYQRLYLRDSTNVRMLHAYAENCRKAFDLDLAIYLYSKLAGLDNGRKYPMTFYHLGQLHKNKANYKVAQQWFNKFSKLKTGAKKTRRDQLDYFRKRARMEMEACDYAQIMMQHPVAALPEHLDQTINSRQSEYAPFEKDSVLYFSSVRAPERRVVRNEDDPPEAERIFYSKIYRSDIRKEKYKKIKALDTTFNSQVFHASNTAFSPDNKVIVVSRCVPKNAAENTCELYQSARLKTRWLTPVRLNDPINQPSVNTTMPAFGEAEGQVLLFFVSDRKGGEGGLDIWYSVRNENGVYTEPRNAGPNINTPEDEISPFFEDKTKTLYFSSTYHKGFGGFDIFKSEYSRGAFSAVVNAGYPVNTSLNDMYYSMNEFGNRAYLSSNRLGSYFDNKVNCCNDIYRFIIDTSVVRPKPGIDSVAIVKDQLKLLVPLTLYFHNDEPEPKTTVTVTSKNYETTYEEYKALEPGYLEQYAAGLKGDLKTQSQDLIRNFFGDSVDVGMEALRKFSDLLEKVLKNGETVKITMKGYCSPLASTSYNINLAKRRISSLRNYFMQTKGGLFAPYVNNTRPGEGKIVFEDVDIGELPKSKVSDRLQDRRNSVYSPYAAAERKIQIIAVSYGRD